MTHELLSLLQDPLLGLLDVLLSTLDLDLRFGSSSGLANGAGRLLALAGLAVSGGSGDSLITEIDADTKILTKLLDAGAASSDDVRDEALLNLKLGRLSSGISQQRTQTRERDGL